jgi:hypothetical protein
MRACFLPSKGGYRWSVCGSQIAAERLHISDYHMGDKGTAHNQHRPQESHSDSLPRLHLNYLVKIFYRLYVSHASQYSKPIISGIADAISSSTVNAMISGIINNSPLHSLCRNASQPMNVPRQGYVPQLYVQPT